MHYLSFFVATLSLIHLVYALPLPFPERPPVSDFSISNLRATRPSLPVARALALNLPLLKQDGTFALQPPYFKRDELERRVPTTNGKGTTNANSNKRKRTRKPTTYGKGTTKPNSKKRKRTRNPKPILPPMSRPENQHLPPHTKIVLAGKAREELDRLNLHGKARKDAIGYHKRIMKAEMKKHGAVEAELTHIAHSGGSDPNEKDHITAKLWNPDLLAIHGAMGTNSHHLYTADHKFPMPKSFTSVHVP